MSYGIYVGKNCTADGSVFLAGFGNEPFSHWLEIVPRRRHAPGATVTVGGASGASPLGPGEATEIPQAAETAKYITMNYSPLSGFLVSASTNGGLNEYQVAGRDIFSPSRRELRERTPIPQRGPTFIDLARIAMERARSAREAVEICGGLIDAYGYTSYGGNSHMFADADEGWIMIEFAGGEGLWVAERLGADDVRAARPGYIGAVPSDYRESPDYRGSPNLISFAVEQGWYDPDSGKPFNVNEVYGDGKMQHPEIARTEAWLRERKGRLTLKDMMEAVRLQRIIGRTNWESAGYGQIAHLRHGVSCDLGRLWVAAATPTTAPFIPYHMGVTDVPPEFKWHRYLSKDQSGKTFHRHGELRPWMGVESTRYAFGECKRLYYLVKEHEEDFLPEVSEALSAFEDRRIEQMPTVEQTAQTLLSAEKPDLARKYLTAFSNTEAMNGLRLVQALAESIEARTKVLYGIRHPEALE